MVMDTVDPQYSQEEVLREELSWYMDKADYHVDKYVECKEELDGSGDDARWEYIIDLFNEPEEFIDEEPSYAITLFWEECDMTVFVNGTKLTPEQQSALDLVDNDCVWKRISEEINTETKDDENVCGDGMKESYISFNELPSEEELEAAGCYDCELDKSSVKEYYQCKACVPEKVVIDPWGRGR